MKYPGEYDDGKDANIVLPVQSAQSFLTSDRPCAGSDWYNSTTNERMAKADLKWYLMNKYRVLFIDKLSRQDLEELQYYHKRQYDIKNGWDHEYLQKFVLKLREYMHDDILKREIAGIETLVTFMKPEDLKKEGLLTGKTDSAH